MTRTKPIGLSQKICIGLGLVCLTGGIVFGAAPKEDPALRREIENSCRKFLDFHVRLQRNGGWATLYHHPTLWAFAGGERHVLKSHRTVDYPKGGWTASTVMTYYLPAYEVFRDKRYLDAARRACDVLVKGQSPNGQLQAHYLVRPDGTVIGARDGDIIDMPDDEGPALPIIMLIWTARLSGEDHYKQAAIRCAELYLEAQNPNGSWAQAYNLRTGRIRSAGYGVLNDGATTAPMNNLLLVYHVTKDAKFLKPLLKAADWLARVQNKQGGIPAWAEQYGEDDLPCWARGFEPPAICPVATSYALGGLHMAYRLTGDEKYLKPARILLKWLEDHPREKWGFYTDPKTAEAIYAVGYKIGKGSAPTSDMRRVGYVKLGKWGQYQPRNIKRGIDSAIRDFKHPPKLDIEKSNAAWRRNFWIQAPGFRKAVAKQNAKGYWPGQSTWKDRAMQCASTVTYAPVAKMLKALHCLAAAEGRVPPYAAGTRKSRRRAWPVPDLYDTPLRKQAK